VERGSDRRRYHAAVNEIVQNTGAELQILAEVALAMLLGGVIGYEREAANKPAGLTTAASLLMSSGLGIAVALRQFVLAIGLAVLVFLVLRVVGHVERRMGARGE
jgi:uncharacterized membrane protein YhiD involved in acid resistance